MANFPNQVLTNGGWNALADALAGQRLTFVRMAVGDGEVASDANLEEATELAHWIMNLDITDYRSRGDGHVVVIGSLKSAQVEEGFNLREIGLFVTLTNSEGVASSEILYSINNAGDEFDYIPGKDEQTVVIQSIEVRVLIGRAENVQVLVIIGEAGLEGENLGAASVGAGIYASREANRLQFKRLTGGTGLLPVVLTETAETIGLAVELTGGEDGGGNGDGEEPEEPPEIVLPIAGLVPTGTVVAFASQTVPRGWLRCIGDEVSRIDYARLFGVIGTEFGVGDEETTFNLPNLARRFPVGAGTAWGLWAEEGGAETHILTEAEMPAHAHITYAHSHAIGVHDHTHGDHGHIHTIHNPAHDHWSGTGVTPVGGSGGAWIVGEGHLSRGIMTDARVQGSFCDWGHANIAVVGNFGGWSDVQQPVTDNRGSSVAHNNMPPYLGLNYIIKD